MLLKTDHDAIEKVRSHPRVREVIDLFRKFVTSLTETLEVFHEPGDPMDREGLWDVTGKSPRTTDISSGKIFIDFVIKLFQREASTRLRNTRSGRRPKRPAAAGLYAL